MGRDLKVILAKADFCSHCHSFLPIFEKAKELAKSDKELSDIKFIIEELDTDVSPMSHENFKTTYGEDVFGMIEGFPTVILLEQRDGKKLTNSVEHTVGETEDAAKKFLEKVKNGIENLKSDVKSIIVLKQEGGKCWSGTGTSTDNKYKDKYIKYKNKYLDLCKKLKK
jgi:hypothetical protein